MWSRTIIGAAAGALVAPIILPQFPKWVAGVALGVAIANYRNIVGRNLAEPQGNQNAQQQQRVGGLFQRVRAVMPQIQIAQVTAVTMVALGAILSSYGLSYVIAPRFSNNPKYQGIMIRTFVEVLPPIHQDVVDFIAHVNIQLVGWFYNELPIDGWLYSGSSKEVIKISNNMKACTIAMIGAGLIGSGLMMWMGQQARANAAVAAQVNAAAPAQQIQTQNYLPGRVISFALLTGALIEFMPIFVPTMEISSTAIMISTLGAGLIGLGREVDRILLDIDLQHPNPQERKRMTSRFYAQEYWGAVGTLLGGGTLIWLALSEGADQLTSRIINSVAAFALSALVIKDCFSMRALQQQRLQQQALQGQQVQPEERVGLKWMAVGGGVVVGAMLGGIFNEKISSSLSTIGFLSGGLISLNWKIHRLFADQRVGLIENQRNIQRYGEITWMVLGSVIVFGGSNRLVPIQKIDRTVNAVVAFIFLSIGAIIAKGMHKGWKQLR